MLLPRPNKLARRGPWRDHAPQPEAPLVPAQAGSCPGLLRPRHREVAGRGGGPDDAGQRGTVQARAVQVVGEQLGSGRVVHLGDDEPPRRGPDRRAHDAVAVNDARQVRRFRVLGGVGLVVRENAEDQVVLGLALGEEVARRREELGDRRGPAKLLA